MNKQKPSFDELKQLPYLRVQDCPTVTGLSQGFVRGLIRDGILPVARHGRCIYVDKQLLLDTVASQLRKQMNTKPEEV